jgi:sulfite reductase (NADPH) hemoprotein beta-component
LKTALRQVADRFSVEFRLTANQNVIIANVSEVDRAGIEALLAGHGVRTENQASALHRVALACPALPTCGLALAESERYLPSLIDRIEALCGELGLAGREITIRMTGCPNGCARPYAAEIGFVGKAPGRYQIWLGGNEASTRLNRLWKDNVKDPDLIPELRVVLGRYAKERMTNEGFGDWVARVLWTESVVAA